jgi:hypothetical protein
MILQLINFGNGNLARDAIDLQTMRFALKFVSENSAFLANLMAIFGCQG